MNPGRCTHVQHVRLTGEEPLVPLRDTLFGPITPTPLGGVPAPEFPRSEGWGRGEVSEPHAARGGGLGQSEERGCPLVPALFQLFSFKLGTSLLTWIICSKEGFGHWRVCEMK